MAYHSSAEQHPTAHSRQLQLVRLHLKPNLGKHQLSALTPQHVQALLNEKLAAGLSPRTVTYLRAVLRRALNQALRWGLVARNVAALTEPPKAVRFQATALTEGQAVALLATARGDRLEALYAVALALGLRQGEALGLRWQDVDLEARTLTVAVALSRVDGKLVLAEPKTATSRRTLPLPTELVAALKDHRARQNAERLRTGERWHDNGLVFTTGIGTPISPRNLVRDFQALRERAGLPPMRFHDLRHSCISFLAAQGVPARTAMEIAGHSQITLTMNVYAHIGDEAKRAALGGLGRLLAVGE